MGTHEVVGADGNRRIHGIYSYHCFLCKQRIGAVFSPKWSIEMETSNIASILALGKLLPLVRSRFPRCVFDGFGFAYIFHAARGLGSKDSSRKGDGLQSADQ